MGQMDLQLDDQPHSTGGPQWNHIYVEGNVLKGAEQINTKNLPARPEERQNAQAQTKRGSNSLILDPIILTGPPSGKQREI